VYRALHANRTACVHSIAWMSRMWYMCTHSLVFPLLFIHSSLLSLFAAFAEATLRKPPISSAPSPTATAFVSLLHQRIEHLFISLVVHSIVPFSSLLDLLSSLTISSERMPRRAAKPAAASNKRKQPERSPSDSPPSSPDPPKAAGSKGPGATEDRSGGQG